MPLRNRVDPWGDLQAAAPRGLFTGNRGCLVDDAGHIVRHHRGSRWIICLTEYRDWHHPLTAPGRWTPLFFLDEAVALAAGHRPCGLCRRQAYLAFQEAVARAAATRTRPTTAELDRVLAHQRLRPGRGLVRGGDRSTWTATITDLPVGCVVVADGVPRLLLEDRMLTFSFGGWIEPAHRPAQGRVTVLTPRISVGALTNGYRPVLRVR